MNSRFGLQNLSQREVASIAAAAATGLLLSSAHPAGIAVSVVMPAIVMRQSRRRAAYAIGAVYYAAALWPLIPGARNFFGPDVSALVAIGLWVSASLLLALPWLLVWSPRRTAGDLARTSRHRSHGMSAARDHRVGIPIDGGRHPLSWNRLVGSILLCRFNRRAGRVASAHCCGD